MVLSVPAVASDLLSGAKASASTPSVWLLRTADSLPVVGPHRRTVPSAPAEASSLPSGLKATARTSLVCPCRVAFSCSVPASHRRMTRSRPPLATSRPSGLKTAQLAACQCRPRWVPSTATSSFGCQGNFSSSGTSAAWRRSRGEAALGSGSAASRPRPPSRVRDRIEDRSIRTRIGVSLWMSSWHFRTRQDTRGVVFLPALRTWGQASAPDIDDCKRGS